MLQPGGVKIWRPRQARWPSLWPIMSYSHPHPQIYVGEGKRDYIPVEKRIAVNGAKCAASMPNNPRISLIVLYFFCRVTPSPVAHSG